jgi:hypothetical protein
MNSMVSRFAYRLLLRLHPASFQDEFGAGRSRPLITRWSNFSATPALQDTERSRSVVHHLRNGHYRPGNRPASPPSRRHHVFVDSR